VFAFHGRLLKFTQAPYRALSETTGTHGVCESHRVCENGYVLLMRPFPVRRATEKPCKDFTLAGPAYALNAAL